MKDTDNLDSPHRQPSSTRSPPAAAGPRSAARRFEWEEKDIFCVPSWTRYRHGAHGEAVLFSFNDLPAMKALGLYREER